MVGHPPSACQGAVGLAKLVVVPGRYPYDTTHEHFNSTPPWGWARPSELYTALRSPGLPGEQILVLSACFRDSLESRRVVDLRVGDGMAAKQKATALALRHSGTV